MPNTNEKVICCKYCGKPIGKGFPKARFPQLDGLISHPECYNADKPCYIENSYLTGEDADLFCSKQKSCEICKYFHTNYSQKSNNNNKEVNQAE